VAVLGRYFWRELGGGDAPPPPDLLQRFEDYDWPGNVRELHNAVAQRVALGDLAGMSKPPPPSSSSPSLPALTAVSATDALSRPTVTVQVDLPFSLARQRATEDFERAYLEHVLAVHGGNVKRAAMASGIARRYFHILKARMT
jgi:DNA-binding NtrC family response regulator